MYIFYLINTFASLNSFSYTPPPPPPAKKAPVKKEIDNLTQLKCFLTEKKCKDKAEAEEEVVEKKRDKKDKKDKKGKKGKGGKGGKDKENKEPYEKPAWKKKAPKDGEKQKKEVDGKTYHWCIHHKEWTMHSSSECRKKSETKEKDDKKKSKKSEKKGKVENLTLKVLQTIAEHVDQGAGTDSESCCSPGWCGPSEVYETLCRPLFLLIYAMLHASGFIQIMLLSIICQAFILLFHHQLYKSRYVPYRPSWKRRFKRVVNRYGPKKWPPLQRHLRP